MFVNVTVGPYFAPEGWMHVFCSVTEPAVGRSRRLLEVEFDIPMDRAGNTPAETVRAAAISLVHELAQRGLLGP